MLATDEGYRRGNNMELDTSARPSAQATALEQALPKAKRRVPIRVTSQFDASPECVFDAWLDPKIAGNWLFATASRALAQVVIDARVGGLFRFVEGRDGERLTHIGQYLEIVRPHRLVFTLSTENNPKTQRSRVFVEIVARGKGCDLTLTHEDVPLHQQGHTEGRWTGILYGLGEMLKDSSRNCATPMVKTKTRVLHRVITLEDVHTGTPVGGRNGKSSITDGPFAETKELLAGF